MVTLTGKVQEVAQSTTGKGIDAVAFLGGIAVWQEWVPTAVGVFTIAWLAMQMVINFPKMCESVKAIFRWFKS